MAVEEPAGAALPDGGVAAMDRATICVVGSAPLFHRGLGDTIDAWPVLRLHDWAAGGRCPDPHDHGDRFDWGLTPPWRPETVRTQALRQPARGWLHYYLPNGLGRRGPFPFPNTTPFQAHACPARPSGELMLVWGAILVLGARRVLHAGLERVLDDPEEAMAMAAFAASRGVIVEPLAAGDTVAAPTPVSFASRRSDGEGEESGQPWN